MQLFSLGLSNRQLRRKMKPLVENLEGRQLLYSTTGNHFSNGTNMTISFVPDGTNLGGATSNLVATFDKTYGAGVWEKTILDAAAYWESVANINFTSVSDNGAAIASGSYQQGNPSFGDIRIGGFAQAASSLAYTIAPPPANGDSSAGDIFFNTAAPIGGSGGYDLETLAIHEIGHALGLGHSADTSAAMYATYRGTKASLATDDIAGVQAVWGPRVNDSYTQNYNNTTFANAADISSQVNAYMQIGVGNLNVAKPSTAYFFKITTPANASNQFAAIVQSNGWSLLAPQVQIYSASKQLLAQNVGNPYAYGDTMGVQINNATPNTTYIVRVLGNTNGPNAIGAYGLLINVGNYAPGPVNPPPARMIPNAPSQGGGTVALSAARNQRNSVVDPDDFTQVGTLQSSGDRFTTGTGTGTHRSAHPARVQVNHSHPTHRVFAKRTAKAAPQTASA